jgi:hypothetical protein
MAPAVERAHRRGEVGTGTIEEPLGILSPAAVSG